MAAALSPDCCQTSQAAIPIVINSVVQTGPNTLEGGFQLGLASVLYQPWISGVVAIAPKPPAPRHTATEMMSPIK